LVSEEVLVYNKLDPLVGKTALLAMAPSTNSTRAFHLVNAFTLVHQRHLGCRAAGAAKRRTAMRMGTANESNCKVDGSGTVLAATHSPD
jgi:hypothetical protein